MVFRSVLFQIPSENSLKSKKIKVNQGTFTFQPIENQAINFPKEQEQRTKERKRRRKRKRTKWKWSSSPSDFF